MSDTTMTDKISNITDTIKTMNDTTAIFILTIVNMVIIGLALLLYFFYTGTIFSNGLRKKGVSLMDTMYGSINGKIQKLEFSFTRSSKKFISSQYWWFKNSADSFLPISMVI